MTNKPTDTRYTPGWLLELACSALGGAIDVDPCTTEDNPTGAEVAYTPSNPAPSPWPPGSVWCNPPWGAGQILPWAQKAMTRPDRDPTLVMTPTDPRTKWFRYLALEADYLIVVTRSVKCWAPELERYVEPSRGVYLWARHIREENLEAFRNVGCLVLPLGQ